MVLVGPVSSLGTRCGCATGWYVQGGSRSHGLWILEEARDQPLPGASGGNHLPIPRFQLREACCARLRECVPTGGFVVASCGSHGRPRHPLLQPVSLDRRKEPKGSPGECRSDHGSVPWSRGLGRGVGPSRGSG